MITLTILMLAAAVGAASGRALRMPAGPPVMAAGLLVGLLPLPIDTTVVREALGLSATFLVFVLGAGLDPRRVGGARRAALRVGLAHVVLPGAAGFSAALVVGFDPRTAAYLGLALAASSSFVAIAVLRRRERLFEPSGRLLVGVVLLQDVVVVALLAMLVASAGGAGRVAVAALGVGVLALAAWIAATRIAPGALLRRPPDDERQTLFLLGLVAVFLGGARVLGLPLVAGAFFGGVALSRFPIGGIVRGQVTSFQDFFVALFFACLGASVTLPTPRELLVVAALFLTAFLVMPALLVPLARREGLTARDALEGAILLASCGELSLIVALVGLENGQIDEGAFRVVVTLALVTMALVPASTSDLVTWRMVRMLPAGRRAIAPHLSGHVLLIGCGDGTAPVLAGLRQAGCPVLVVDTDPEVVRRLQAAGVPALRGDGSDAAVLEEAGLRRAAVVVSTIGSVRDNRRLIRAARGRPVLVRVFSEAQASRIREVGGHAVVAAEAAREAFHRWREASAMPTPPGGSTG